MITKEVKSKPKYAQSLALIFIIGYLIFMAWLMCPYIFISEDTLCEEAIYSAKEKLKSELSDWINYEAYFNLAKGERIVSWSITNTDCEVISKCDSEVDVTFEINLKTSFNNYERVGAIVEVYGGSADFYDFYNW